VHIEKCGGTTLIHMLRRNFGLNHFDIIPADKTSSLVNAADVAAVRSLRPSSSSIAGHSVRAYLNLADSGVDLEYYTILRDPIKRYISDYQHFVEVLHYPDDFENWLERSDRFNLQTKAISGGEDVDLAKSLLRHRFSLVGIIEEFDLFLSGFRALVFPVPFDTHYIVKNSSTSRRVDYRTKVDINRYAKQIADRNALDLELYQFVSCVLLPEQEERFGRVSESAIPRWKLLISGKLNSLYRNLVYKPFVGRLPFSLHALPKYLPYKRR